MSCNNKDDAVIRTGVHYFSSFKHYKIPFEPADEISEKEANQLTSYYKGIFDNQGKLLEFSKVGKNGIVFKAAYQYRENGVVKECVIVNADGVASIQKFDENGRLMNNQ